MLLSAVFLDLGVDILHQGVPLHQHVREGRAREDPDHLLKVRQIIRLSELLKVTDK